ncbi:hypothetical protein [Candidatus Tisiphia endosymbiont of Nedyus quadrimaculatus]|uniref:hypothetical protein n=1 Tax=Candidatus Tisiphia endosymbiont of Nedyus quadrimaculatus TaxID=3139332 RepID=UPI00345EE147
MSKQQNDLVTKQDVEEAYLFTKPNVEEAKKILISVQDQDIEAVYKVALPSRILQKLIVALPSRIQQELNDQNIKANAVYKIVSLPSRILQKFNAKTSDAKKILTNAEKIKILTNAEKILTKELSDLKTSYATNEEQYNIIDSKSQELNNLCTKLATEKEELEQVQK